jgi:hypothetical protein
MAQATAAGLPGALDTAGRFSGCGRKASDGKELIKLFCLPGSNATPHSHPDEWQSFLDYAANDVEVMREIFKHTLQLPWEDWQEYWAAERINLNGISFDQQLAAQAAGMAKIDKVRSAHELHQLTDGAVTGVTKVQSMIAWLQTVLRTSDQSYLEREREHIDEETGEITGKDRFSLDRERINLLTVMLDAKPDITPQEIKARRLLEIRQYGGSTTPAKFSRMLETHVDGLLLGQFVFNGASQTGRFCVAADTSIDTPSGSRKIVDLLPGSIVYGGSGEPRPVLARIYKGREQMVRLAGPDGAFVVATMAHRILTRRGWKRIDECFETTAAGHYVLCRGYAPVSYRQPQHRRDWQDAWRDTAHGSRRGQARNAGEGVQATEVCELFSQQDGREQSDDGCTLRRRTYPAARPGGSLERRGLHVRIAGHGSEVIGSERTAGALGSAPHRWRQDQRRYRQLCDSDQARTPEAAQDSAWSLVCVGEEDVWDISVAGDASYLAQGLVHHNSSRGIQLQNLTRDALDYELDAIDALRAGCTIDTFEKIGDNTATSRKLSMLIRPTLIPECDNNAFVWGDWSQIEARVLPWLAGADDYLDIFREVDIDPSKPDLYVRSAAAMSDIPIEQVTKPLRQRGKVAILACIAAGQQVLTDRGLVAIENVTTDMRIWDGCEFVAHNGVVFRGVKDVYEYDGLVATSDHIVWTAHGQCQFADAAACGSRLLQSGAGRTPLRVGDDHQPGAALYARLERRLCAGALQRVRRRGVDVFKQLDARRIARVSAMFAAATDTDKIGSSSHVSEKSLHQPERPRMEKLRRSRNRVSFRQYSGCWLVGDQEYWFAGARRGAGSPRQRRALRTWKPALAHTIAANAQYAVRGAAGGLGLSTGAVALCKIHGRASAAQRLDARGSFGTRGVGGRGAPQGMARYRGKARTFDIVNCGPRNRFTVSNALVHNCGFGGGKAALQRMAANYGMYLDDKQASEIVNEWRTANPWAVDYWADLWKAFMDAMHTPGQEFSVGPITYIYDHGYLGGTMWCRLPCGRILTYRRLRWERVEDVNDAGEITDSHYELTFARAFGRIKLWPGILAENCIVGDARVLTSRGWIRLDSVTLSDKLWDGVEWVAHDGLIVKGARPVIDFDGVRMTADHQVLTTEGWRDAACARHNRASVRLPDSDSFFAFGWWTRVADPLRLWQRTITAGKNLYLRRLQVMRLPYIGNDVESAELSQALDAYAWHERAPGLLGVAFDDRSLSVTVTPSVAQLRWAWHQGVQALATIVRKLLGRYGTNISSGFDVRADEQRQRLFANQLPVDDASKASGKHPSIAADQRERAVSPKRDRTNDAALSVAREVVYDIKNAGPRSRFVVLTASGPLLVHNCTQATAASILRGTLVRAVYASDMPVPRAHTHDEILLECPVDRAEAMAVRLIDEMERGFDWSAGLPIKAESTIAYAYTKCAAAQGL